MNESQSRVWRMPEEWTIEHHPDPTCDCIYINSPGGVCGNIATIYNGGHEQGATAHLVVSAPKLLKACIEAEKELNERGRIGESCEALGLLRDAISSARGW